MSTTVPALTLRVEKAAPLTSAEGDKNLKILRDAINGAFALLAVALKSDGTLKDNAVATLSIIDRAVTNAKLAFGYAFYAADTGAVNALVVTFTPVPTTYVAGMVFFVKVLITNTGPAAIVVNGLASLPIKKNGNTALVAGDLTAGQIIELVYDPVLSTAQLVNTMQPSSIPMFTGVVYQQATPTVTVLTNAFVEIATVALVLPAGKKWASIRVVFGGVNHAANGTHGIQFESNPIRHNGTGLSLVHNVTPNGFSSTTSAVESPFILIAEGVPTDYTTVNLDLEIRAKFPTAASVGDDATRRTLYAVGYYTNA